MMTVERGGGGTGFGAAGAVEEAAPEFPGAAGDGGIQSSSSDHSFIAGE